MLFCRRWPLALPLVSPGGGNWLRADRLWHSLVLVVSGSPDFEVSLKTLDAQGPRIKA